MPCEPSTARDAPPSPIHASQGYPVVPGRLRATSLQAAGPAEGARRSGLVGRLNCHNAKTETGADDESDERTRERVRHDDSL